jgi:DNA-binding beta-propeller fold protein YncE
MHNHDRARPLPGRPERLAGLLLLSVLLSLLISCGDTPQATQPIILAQPAMATEPATGTAHAGATSIATAPAQGIEHDEYIFPDGKMYVYRMDGTPRLIKQRDLPTTSGVRGVVGNAALHRLYISFGSDGDGGGQLLAYDVLSDRILWTHSYASGIDSMAITPDGRYIYMPDGEKASSPYWYVIRTTDGQPTGLKINGGPGPHNTVISLNGQHVYMGARNFANTPTYLTVADTAGGGNIRKIGPFLAGIRPFVINGKETLAYVSTTGFLGFQVADLRSGHILYTVDLSRMGFPDTPTGPSAPSHGVALSPDERRLAVIDWPHNMVHIFDVTGVPASAPRKIADIAFSRSMHHDESNCAYDCAADGWLQYSRDGRFLYVGDVGDVIDTAVNRVIYNLPPLYNTRKMIEVDFLQGRCSFLSINRASVGYITV